MTTVPHRLTTSPTGPDWWVCTTPTGTVEVTRREIDQLATAAFVHGDHDLEAQWRRLGRSIDTHTDRSSTR